MGTGKLRIDAIIRWYYILFPSLSKYFLQIKIEFFGFLDMLSLFYFFIIKISCSKSSEDNVSQERLK